MCMCMGMCGFYSLDMTLVAKDLCHHDFCGIPRAIFRYLVGRGREHHHSCCYVTDSRRRLAEGLEFCQVCLVQSVQSLLCCLKCVCVRACVCVWACMCVCVKDKNRFTVSITINCSKLHSFYHK